MYTPPPTHSWVSHYFSTSVSFYCPWRIDLLPTLHSLCNHILCFLPYKSSPSHSGFEFYSFWKSVSSLFDAFSHLNLFIMFLFPEKIFQPLSDYFLIEFLGTIFKLIYSSSSFLIPFRPYVRFFFICPLRYLALLEYTFVKELFLEHLYFTFRPLHFIVMAYLPGYILKD